MYCVCSISSNRHWKLILDVWPRLQNVVPLFYRLSFATWESLLVASEDCIRAGLAWARSRPGCSGSGSEDFDPNACELSEKEFRAGLTRTEIEALDDYIKLHPGLCYCVGQNPQKRAMMSTKTHWQTLINNVHILWAHSAGRWATPD